MVRQVSTINYDIMTMRITKWQGAERVIYRPINKPLERLVEVSCDISPQFLIFLLILG